MNSLKPALVNVPVRVNIWIRPECQKRQFEILKEARPSILFLISDGGRNEREWKAIRQNRKMIDEQIDWECTVYRLYEDKNQGLYTMARKGAKLIWSIVDRCIFLEDDYVPSITYFQFCAELLERYKDDERIEAICGMNHCETWDNATADYFFATEGSIWGIATWRKRYEERDFEFSYAKDPYVMGLLKKKLKNEKGFWRKVEGYPYNPLLENHTPGGEFFYRLAIHMERRLYIIPKKNMISNVGCTADGAHAAEYHLLPKGIRRVFGMKTYELEGSLKHMKYVIADEEYVKRRNRIMAVDHPLVAFWRRMESFFLTVRYKGARGIFNKIRKKAQRRKTIEK